jgi:hypothetical protein
VSCSSGAKTLPLTINAIIDWIVPALQSTQNYDPPNSTTANICSWYVLVMLSFSPHN